VRAHMIAVTLRLPAVACALLFGQLADHENMVSDYS
jgi:hypothetical protein